MALCKARRARAESSAGFSGVLLGAPRQQGIAYNIAWRSARSAAPQCKVLSTLPGPMEARHFLWRQFKSQTEYTITQAIAAQIPGLVSLSIKFLPTVMNLLRRLAEEGQRQVNGEPQRNPPPASFCSSPNDRSDVSSCASSNMSSSEKNVAEYSSPSIPDKAK
ncbi:hypothetical protein KY284_027651 [Solanum tuberosum]|nr:hypothetical protein KY284_027651 [Solanum tuberosum]